MVINRSSVRFSPRLARQRTFEGAYWRTCLSAFGFALIILRIFEPAFYNIGLVFVGFGALMLAIAALRRRKNGDIFDTTKPFETGGGFVLLTSLLAFATYVTLLVFIVRLGN
ncbi:9858_t:CDS:1 [Paraglomus occultum]|uniref:9858_t:CDS:1 n=1 Tax=Paraglomus occultum TaxID=144539 RepID=A0A9N8WGC7_9GLOM|nr:9858_t:CDS:1 [Paraglomus occultum]